MKMLTGMQLAAGGALMLAASLAQAQYVWVNEKGVKEYSDRAPPGSIPVAKILKSPTPIKDPLVPADPLLAPRSVPKASASLAERDADYRKRQEEKQKVDSEAAAAASQAAQRQSACNAARAAQAQLSSGRRLRGPDQGFLDANQRSQQEARINETLSQCN